MDSAAISYAFIIDGVARLNRTIGGMRLSVYICRPETYTLMDMPLEGCSM